MEYVLSVIFDYFEVPYKKKYFVFPESTFGIFVTVYFNGVKHNNNVHGCMGYWDDNLNYNNEMLNVKIFEVAKQSLNEHRNDKYINDEHKKRKLNGDTIIEIHLLQKINNNLYKINYDNGYINDLKEYFNNSKYGLIFINENNKKTTYLVDVFENQDWIYIRDSLINKSGGDNKGTFYCYQEERYSCKFIDKNLIIPDITDFMNLYYNDDIPYSIENNKIIYNHSEYVRNIASMIYVYNLDVNNDIKDKIKNSIGNYCNIINIDNHVQSYIFILHMLYIIGKINNCHDINHIQNAIYDKLDNVEVDFTYGEALKILAITKFDFNKLKKHIVKIQNMLYIDINFIFRMNWFVQFIVELKNNYNIDNEYLTIINNIINNIIKYIKYVNIFNDAVETNILAVTFEMLSGLYKLTKNKYILNYSFNIFKLLLKRRNNDGIFTFLDGSARIDITFHVLSGLYYFD